MMCREQERLYKSENLVFTDLSTVVVARERVQRPPEHMSSDIFNTAHLWEYGAEGLG